MLGDDGVLLLKANCAKDQEGNWADCIIQGEFRMYFLRERTFYGPAGVVVLVGFRDLVSILFDDVLGLLDWICRLVN